MWKNRELFVLVLFVSLVESDRIQKLPNVSLSWSGEFHANLSWTAPEQMEGRDCEYIVSGWESDESRRKTKQSYIYELKTMEKNLSLSIDIKCDNSTRTVDLNFSFPEIVKDFQCVHYTNKSMNCSWIPVSNMADIQLFYWYIGSEVKVCSHYLYEDRTRTGCHLTEKNFTSKVYFLVNGTLDDRSMRNTFLRIPWNNIKAPLLNVTLTPEGERLNIGWTPPGIHKPHCWNYTMNYTVCDDLKPLVSLADKTSYQVHLFPYCQYRVAVQAVLQQECGKGETPWNQRIYGKDWNRYVFMYIALVMIPVVIAVTAVSAFVCLRRHKDKILPKVPEPVDFLRDVFNNLNDPRITRSLYVPAQEEVNCNITLVQEPES